MISMGLDCGAKSVRAVVLRDGKIAGTSTRLAGLSTSVATDEACAEALESAGLTREDVKRVFATGVGRNEPEFVHAVLTEVSADARGVHAVCADVRTIVDVGAEEARVIKVDAHGKVVDFAVNERCAAGTGAFIEAMARILEMTPEELGALALTSTKELAINSQCVVFAESEIVSMVHSQVSKPNMAKAVLNAVVDKIVPMVRRLGAQDVVTVIGGVSKNLGFIKCLEDRLAKEVQRLDNAEYLGALGAAVAAAGSVSAAAGTVSAADGSVSAADRSVAETESCDG